MTRRRFVGALVPVAAALLTAWLTPRGPVGTAEALVSMGAAAGLGVLAGFLLARRWSVVAVPLVFVVVLELARLPVVGATVDAIRLDSVYGWIGLVAGRGVHGLLVLVPMALGCRLGVELAARRGTPGAVRFGRPGAVVSAVTALALVGLAVVVAQPASTAPVAAASGEPAAGSVAELVTVPVGDSEQALMVRGADTDAPVLLHLAGGPGGTDLGAMRLDESLEQDFVVVTWDQPGTGKSYGALDPVDDMTLDRVVDDTLAVTEYLRERFDEERIYLTAQSWGTLPSVLAMAQHPERYAGYVGTGQMVDILETDTIFWTETLDWARARGDTELVQRLERLGPPPYADMLDYTVLVSAERQIYAYPEFDGSTEMTSTIWVPENAFMDRVGAIRGLLDTYSVLYPQLQTLDLRTEVPELDVPVYLVMGEHEARGRVAPAREWFEQLRAPTKEWVELPDSSHRASFERPDDYAALLRRVLAETSTAR